MSLNYKLIPHSMKILLEDYCSEDPYKLHPSTLYNNIVGTLKSASVPTTAKIFDVSESLVWMIYEANKQADRDTDDEGWEVLT